MKYHKPFMGSGLIQYYLPWHGHCIRRDIFMKTNQPTTETQESTYALLMRSENEKRSLLEMIAYGLFILSVVAAIWQVAHQPINAITTLPRSETQTEVAVDPTQPDRIAGQNAALRNEPRHL
jgi:hypothetical protein